MRSSYENYPFWMIVLANAVSLSIYIIGLFILAQLGIIFAVLYLAYCFWVEISLYRGSCINCHYYGKFCGFGKGRICAYLFPKGDPKKFIERKLTWKDIIPDFLVFIFPLLGGIVLLILQFNWIILAAIIVIIFLSFMGNAFIRGSFSCKYCKQRELGCPASQLFSQANK